MATIITIKNTRGEIIADVASKEILKDVLSLALIGRGAESYIEDLNQNFIKLLENFASSVAPTDPITGQMWFDTSSNILKTFNGSSWGYNVTSIGGKNLQTLKSWILGYVNIDDKLNKSGGTISGALTVGGDVYTSGNVTPSTNETLNLGSATQRFKTLYIKEKSIFLGDNAKYHITKDSFVYTVNSNEADVSKIPTGVIILNINSGDAVIKRSNGKFDSSNAKFGQLVYDLNNAVKLGRVISGFQGDNMINAGGWTSNGWTVVLSTAQLTTTGNAKYFGTGRTLAYYPVGVTGGNRGLFHGGGNPGVNWTSQLEYMTFSTPGNTQYFGNAEYRSVGGQGVSDGTRAIFSGGWNGWWNARNDIEYLTISTPSNTKKFGTSSKGRYWSNTHITDGIKGVNAAGWNNGYWYGIYNDMEYTTIATPSNGIYFGALRWQRWCNTGNTDGVKGFVMGGWWCPQGSVEVMTLAAPSNSSYFGNVGNYFAHAGSAGNGTKIAVTGGWGYGWDGWRQIRQFATNTPQNATYFGELDVHRHVHDAISGN